MSTPATPDTTPGGTPDTTQGDPTPTPPGGTPGGTTPPAPAGTPEGGDPQKVEDLPAWAQRLIRETRSEAANHRTKASAAEAAQADVMQRLAKALGLTEDEKPDPERLAKDLASRDSDLRDARVELAVIKAAGKAGADPDALTDSRAFMDRIRKLDPADDDFTGKVRDLIKAAVDDNPRLRVAQVAAQGGADHTPGGTGGTGATGGTGDSMADIERLIKDTAQNRTLRRPRT